MAARSASYSKMKGQEGNDIGFGMKCRMAARTASYSKMKGQEGNEIGFMQQDKGQDGSRIPFV